MKAYLENLSQARTAKFKTASLINPLVGEIADALLELGGAAHRDLVIDRVALRRGGHAASDGLRRDVMDAFAQHCDRARDECRHPLLHLPFGDGTRRWSLTHDAVTLLRPSPSAKAQ